MNLNKLSSDEAFSAGARLWVIKNDPTLHWWKKLDLHSKYLLSQNYCKPRREPPIQIQNILNATDLDLLQKDYTQNSLLLGTEDHFLNHWLLLWENLSDAQLLNLVARTFNQLQAGSLRLFSHTHIIENLQPRLTASSMTISYIENT